MENKAMKNNLNRGRILNIISVLILILLWVLISGRYPDFLPTPAQTGERLIQLFHKPIGKYSIGMHIWASLKRVLVALFFSIVLGIVIGVAMGWNRWVNAILGPIITVLRPIPPIAWIPLMILWFGVGELPKVLLIFIGTIFIVVLNSSAGVHMVDQTYINVGKIYGANTWQMLRHIVFPASFPAIIAGIKTALGCGWSVVVAAEMIASKQGLGFLITRGSDSLDYPLVMIGMILIGMIGAMLSGMFSWIERRICVWDANR
jgi:ABC-type nitrate/sulfonate/bicarbonate transport system permease component